MTCEMHSAIVDFIQERYDAKPAAVRQTIDDYHNHLAQLQTDYPLTWKDRERNLYEKHIGECPPCFASILVQSLKRRIDEKDIESMILDLKNGKEL